MSCREQSMAVHRPSKSKAGTTEKLSKVPVDVKETGILFIIRHHKYAKICMWTSVVSLEPPAGMGYGPRARRRTATGTRGVMELGGALIFVSVRRMHSKADMKGRHETREAKLNPSTRADPVRSLVMLQNLLVLEVNLPGWNLTL